MRLAGLITSALLMAWVSNAKAEKSFTWDAGLAVASVSFPAYRGASNRSQLTLPVPSLAIESRDFQLGRNGADLALNRSKRFRLRLTASGSLPVNSDDVRIREGMPDLHSSFEAGPALEWHVWEDTHWSLTPELLIRGVIATDLRDFEAIGGIANPRIRLDWKRVQSPERALEWNVAVGPVYGSQEYHAYFYSVDAAAARPDRPEYQAHSGYGGWRAKTRISYVRGRLGIYAYASYDDLRDASFADSPLVEQRDYWLAGLMVNWRIWGPKTVTLRD